MAVEIELKLSLPLRSAPRLRRFVSSLGLSSRRQWLVNIYLDTPDLILMQEKMALRRRQIARAGEKIWLLTVKTEGVTVDGLSRRAEWEFPMPPELLDFSGVNDLVLSDRLTQLSPELKPVFRVDFVRQSWNLPGSAIGLDKSNVELALDIGYISAEKNVRRKAFCELELELMEGDEKALAIWGERICQELPELQRQAMSKAARGYALLFHSRS